MSNKQLLLRVITPKGVVYEEYVTSLKVNKLDGIMMIFKNYAPVLEKLVAGDIVVNKKGKKIIISLGNGWLTVDNNRCNVFSSSAVVAV